MRVLRAEQHALEVDLHDPLVLLQRSVGEHAAAPPTPATLSTASTRTEGVERGGEHGLDLGLVGDVALERHDALAERRGGLLLTSADVDGEHLGAFAHEHLGRCPAHAEPAPVMTATFPSSSPIFPPVVTPTSAAPPLAPLLCGRSAYRARRGAPQRRDRSSCRATKKIA